MHILSLRGLSRILALLNCDMDATTLWQDVQAALPW